MCDTVASQMCDIPAMLRELKVAGLRYRPVLEVLDGIPVTEHAGLLWFMANSPMKWVRRPGLVRFARARTGSAEAMRPPGALAGGPGALPKRLELGAGGAPGGPGAPLGAGGSARQPAGRRPGKP